MGSVVLSGVCVFKSGLSPPIRVSLIVAPDSSPRGFGRVDGFGQRVFLRFFPFDVISQCLCIRQTHLSASPADVTTRRSGYCAHRGSTSRRVPLCLFVPGTRRVRALRGGQGDNGACCSAAGAFGALFEGGRPEPMLCRLASRGSASLYFVQLRLGAVTEGILFFVEGRIITGSPTQL